MINTTNSKLPKPQLTDIANIEQSIQPYAKLADGMMVSRYATLAARNTAIQTPVFGQMCYVTATGELYIYGAVGAWISAVPRVVRKTTETQIVNNSTTLVNDDTMSFSLEANSIYAGNGNISFDSNTTADIKVQWALPSGAIGYSSFYGTDGSTGIATGQFSITSVATHAYSGFGVATTVKDCFYIITSSSSGTAQMKWAQSVATVVDTKFLIGTNYRIYKVA